MTDPYWPSAAIGSAPLIVAHIRLRKQGFYENFQSPALTA